ncbi:NAD(P)-binding protein [Xylariaceae sp. FL0255]|nr:NAD(P)-binding protein [Xylariaceae sp. FL0255]
MSAIRKVAIAGATGNLGPTILRQVVDAGFEVTVLTRTEGSSPKLQPYIKVEVVDYDSLDSLVHALRGQDALVSTLGSVALLKQLLLVEAAAKAGVKRFIPSEFGSNTVHPKTAQLPSFRDKIVVQEALKKEAEKADGLTYSLVAKDKSITLWDGGERIFSTTTLSTIGRAVAGVLKHPEETKNRAVYVQDAAISAKQLLVIGEKATGTNDWKGNVASIDEQVAKGWEELKKPQPNPANFVRNFITAAIWGEGYGSKFEKLDNDLLGIKEMSEADIAALIRELRE